MTIIVFGSKTVVKLNVVSDNGERQESDGGVGLDDIKDHRGTGRVRVILR